MAYKDLVFPWTIAMNRVRGMGFAYPVVLSFINIIMVDSDRVGIEFDFEKQSTCLKIGDKFKFSYKNGVQITNTAVIVEMASFIIRHEVEHVMRLHIQRTAKAMNLSSFIKKATPVIGYGKAYEKAAYAANLVQDYMVNADIRVPDVYGCVSSIQNVADALGIDVRKIGDQVNYNNATFEKLFYAIDRIMEVEDPEKSQTDSPGNGGGSPEGGQADDSDPDGDKNKGGNPGIQDGITNDVDPKGYKKQMESKGVYADSSNMESMVCDNSTRSMLATLKTAGVNVGELIDADIEATAAYTIESFVDRVSSFSVTEDIRYSRNRPPRRPNCPVGLTRMTMAPTVAMCVDASGSVPERVYREFFEVSKTVSERSGAKILFVIFDGDVVYCDTKIPEKITKSNGGTRFIPPLLKAREMGFNNVMMLTDMANCDDIDIEHTSGMSVLWIMDDKKSKGALSCRYDIPNSDCYYIDPSGKLVIPLCG